jgi:DNA-binding transcriptional MerR regulator
LSLHMIKLSQAAQAANISARTLSDWLARKLIDIPAYGTGTHRQFTRDDVIRIALISELVGIGIAIGEAAKAAATLCDDAGADRDAADLFPNGKTILLVDSENSRCINVADREQFESAMLAVYEDVRSVIAVVLNTVVARVDAALASGSPPRGAVTMLYRHGRQLHV